MARKLQMGVCFFFFIIKKHQNGEKGGGGGSKESGLQYTAVSGQCSWNQATLAATKEG